MAYRRCWKRRGKTMRIMELQMKNFGKFSGKSISFHEGINIIYGQNEMGKTTIHTFIKGMFFGIEKQRGRASKNDEYSLRQPWENPGYFAGALRFETGGKIFRLERNFEKREKSVCLLCETDGEELSVEDGDLEVLLEGLNEVSFQNTIFINQRTGATDEGLAVEVQRYMSNLECAGDSELDVGQAIKVLDEKRRQFEAKRKENQISVTARLQEVQMKMDYVAQETAGLKSGIEDGKDEADRILFEKEKAERERKAAPPQKEVKQAEYDNIRRNRRGLGSGAGALILLSAVFISNIVIKLLIVIAVLIAAGVLYLKWNKDRLKMGGERSTDTNREQQLTLVAKLDEEYRKRKWNVEHLQQEWREKRMIQGNLEETREEIREQGAQAEKLDEEIQAVLLAMNTIKEVSGQFYKRTEKKLNNRVSEILSDITGGRYTNVFVDADMQVRINTPQKLLNLNQVSRGTMEQIYFALRMAVGEMLCQKEPMPVILDDAFATYDEERLRRTLKWLHESGRQALLFTCHKREQEILDEIT